jgi:hypothetical protein
MSTESRRRLGAVTAMVVGVFVGLTFLPIPLTGPLGGYIGHGLWRMLGAGAVGIPVLGVGLALAGFDRLGKLDMKRSAILIVGLSLLLPYLIGVLTGVSRNDLDLDQRGLATSLVGWLPGFFAETISGAVGVLGAVLLGFLALSALTLATFAWHPLQRLERGAGQRGSGTGMDGAASGAAERRRSPRKPASGDTELEAKSADDLFQAAGPQPAARPLIDYRDMLWSRFSPLQTR